VVNSEQSNEENCMTKFEDIKAFHTDIKNFVLSDSNRIGKSGYELLAEFNRRFPGYKQVLDHQNLQNEAEKLNSWGWT
jgi:putative DNA primase/helicase